MNLTINGRHMEVTPSLRNYVMAKLERILRHFDQVMEVRILLAVHKQKEKEKRQRAGCMLRVKGQDLFVETSHFDLYAAVDALADKLDRAVVRYKQRTQGSRHGSAKRLDDMRLTPSMQSA
ncbi:ribosome hibernation-promoting factor, HPF/YfiA family [Comamonas composti]|uniref:ribosome hibernation-promoting factor, HPF/YfiA family n=1 Tax=Comamonas composti TaxID=408558 RepID=UPI0004179E8E|nr:ribosome-associated translation inhibitor RaiA [Comamonas composti]